MKTKQTLSSFIAELQSDLNMFGDLPIQIFTYDGEGEAEAIHIMRELDNEGNPRAVTLGDASWADAFSE